MLKRVVGILEKIERNDERGITRLWIRRAGRIRFACFKDKPPKALKVGRGYKISVDTNKLKLVQVISLDRYGNLERLVYKAVKAK
jgi:hypothetical protein